MHIRTVLVLPPVAALLALLGACGATPSGMEAPQASATLSAPSIDPDTGLLVFRYQTPPNITGNYPHRCALRVGGAPRPVPDHVCTPGSVGDLVTRDNIDQTICVPHWTDRLRPGNASVVKAAAMQAYRIPMASVQRVELDHLVPLSLGGADDVTNVWPQFSDLPGTGFNNSKDTVEQALLRAVCAHKVTLAQARKAITTDWTTARVRLKV